MARLPKMLTAFAAAGALVLAGCSSGGDTDKAEKAAGENKNARGAISFAMGKNDIEKLQPIVERWNSSHPNEKVNLVQLAGEADAQRDTLVQSLQNGSGDYDLMALDVPDIARFAAEGWLQKLEGELAVDTAGLVQATVDSATYRGTAYAVPMNTNVQLLFRNTELVPTAPTNWQGLADSCTSVRDRGKQCLLTQLKPYEGLTVNTTEFIHGWGGTVVGADGRTPTVNSPESRTALQAMVDGLGNGTISRASLSATEEETNNGFVGGDFAYAINWPYMYDNAAKAGSAVAGKFAVSPILGRDGEGRSTLGGYNNAINVFSKHKATARDFAAFIISEESQRGFAEQAFPPVLRSIYEDRALEASMPYLRVMGDALRNAQPRPVTPYYKEISQAIYSNANRALSGQASADQAISDMAAAISTAGN